jgi:hypothetical protein
MASYIRRGRPVYYELFLDVTAPVIVIVKRESTPDLRLDVTGRPPLRVDWRGP